MKPGYIVGGIVIFFCIVVTAMALSGTVRRTVSFTEARQAQQPCEIYGAVVKDSVTPDMATGHFSFALQECDSKGKRLTDGAVMRVLCLKSKPSNFDQATHVKAIGMMSGDRFTAQDLLVKCPSKYQGVPREKADAGLSGPGEADRTLATDKSLLRMIARRARA